jgi:hypothetical protein
MQINATPVPGWNSYGEIAANTKGRTGFTLEGVGRIGAEA